ncbi:MAG: bifunctional oligoribonuclease/PAP phosphatase NrnA [Clostridia bacterium]|nr:bifunctional oligoribonuclease/PAP phosphatase NrnA [Clostridia bacterium]
MAQNDAFCPDMLSALQGANSILLCTHISPDGDAIGSTLAMGLGLQAMGKQIVLCCADPVPFSYSFLPGAGQFVRPDALTGRHFDVGFAIDAADLGRIGACAPAFQACPVTLQIDHHPTNPLYAQVNVVDGTAPAAGCIVRRALRGLNVPLNQEIAQCLYCAISTDTGNFCFRGTSAEAFRIAAELVETGFPLAETARTVHLMREEPHVRLLGRALISLRKFGDGRCACMRLTAEDYAAAGAQPEHCDRIVNYALNIPGVEMAYLADGSEPGQVKASLRAIAPRNVSVIAQQFGGGGHVLASGFRCEGELDEICRRIEREMLRQIGETA